MARQSPSHRPRCPYYPTREATDRCDRCYTLVSPPALTEHHGARLCPRCHDAANVAAEVREEARLTPANLWRRFRNIDYPMFALGLGVLAVILAIGGYIVYTTANAQSDPMLIRRARVGFTQNFDIDGEGLDFVEILNLGVASATSQSPDPVHNIDRLHDGLPDGPVPSWRSADANFPIDIRLAATEPQTMAKVVVWNHPLEDPSTYLKDIEIYATVPDAAGGSARRVLVAEFTVLPVAEKQVFLLDAEVVTTSTIVRVLSNYGGAYVSAAEIGLFNPHADTIFGDPNISQGPLP